MEEIHQVELLSRVVDKRFFLKRLGLTYEEERIRVEVELNGEVQGDPDFILS